jgi:hypothetical protein
MNDKLRAINNLIKKGLTIPSYFVVSKRKLPRLNSILANYKNIQCWYLRSIQTEEHMMIRCFVTSVDLSNFLKKAFLENPDAQIIVQERVNVRFSGALASNGKLIFVEYVKGGLQGLLRDGCTPSRLVLDIGGGKINIYQKNRQEFWYRWDNDQIIKESSIDSGILSEEICNELIGIAHLSESPVVYEWVESHEGKLFFVDIKDVPKEFLIDEWTLLKGIEQNMLCSLNLPIKGSVIKNISNNVGVYVIKEPLYDYIETILQKATAIILENGGLLSHLSVYAAQHQVPCVISRKFYNKCIHQKEINTSIKQLLK